jgi:hypothetical protein
VIQIHEARIGRGYAFAAAATLAAGTILSTLVSLNIITPQPPSLSNGQLSGANTLQALASNIQVSAAYQQTTLLQTVIPSLLLMLAFLALIPVGLALRRAFGSELAGDVMASAFLVGGLLAATFALLSLGLAYTVVQMNQGTPTEHPEAWPAFAEATSSWNLMLQWLLLGGAVLLGIATYQASRLALATGTLGRRWAQFGFVVAAGWLIGAAIGIGAILLSGTALRTALDVPDQVSNLVVGVLLVPGWAIWLALELGRMSDAPVRAAPVRSLR